MEVHAKSRNSWLLELCIADLRWIQMERQLNYEWTIVRDRYCHFNFHLSNQRANGRWAMAATGQRFPEHAFQQP